jgi:hypothetical protein
VNAYQILLVGRRDDLLFDCDVTSEPLALGFISSQKDNIARQKCLDRSHIVL